MNYHNIYTYIIEFNIYIILYILKANHSRGFGCRNIILIHSRLRYKEEFGDMPHDRLRNNI